MRTRLQQEVGRQPIDRRRSLCQRARGIGLFCRLRREDGVAMVEFALILPVLLIFVTGILQMGLMLNKYITLTDAVRSGARNLSLGRGLDNPCAPAIDATFNSAQAGGVTLDKGQINPVLLDPDTCGSGSYPSFTGGKMVQGDAVTVTATYPYTLSIFGMPVKTINLTAQATDAAE